MTTKTAETPRLNRAYETAVRRLVHSFSNVDHDAFQALAEREGEEVYAMPMWGTLFKVEDSCDRRGIEGLLVDPCDIDEGSEPEDLESFAQEHGIDGFDISEYTDPCGDCAACAADECDKCSAPEIDTASAAEYLREQWQDSGSDDAMLASAGWQDVGGTGLIAHELAGDFYLGINGAGFSFYGNIETGDRSGIWPRLYTALGYSWHESDFRAAVVEAATRALCWTAEGSEAEQAALATLRKANARRGEGGDLTAEEIAEGEAV